MNSLNMKRSVTGVILAGGRGRRLGGRDKGLVTVQGRPLIEQAIAAFAPQVSEVIINANRNISLYERYGYPVVADVLPDCPGPLAGMLTGLRHARHDDVVVVPCDALSLPPDLVERLYQALVREQAAACTVYDGERLHPVHAWLNRRLAASLERYLRSGRRKVEDWMREQRLALADFSDSSQSFRNLNTVEDLEGFEP